MMLVQFILLKRISSTITLFLICRWTGGQYYHLTSGQYNFVTGIYADQIDPTNDVFFEKNVSVSGTLLLGSGTDNSLSGIRTAADGSFSQAGDAQYSEFILKREIVQIKYYLLKFIKFLKV